MPGRKTIIWIAIGAVVLTGIIYFAFFRAPKVEYNASEVKRADLRETVSVTGTLKADETIVLNFETTGRISEVRVRVGQKVAKGDVLGILDDENLQNAVDQAKANLAKARADAGANADAINTAEVAVENAEDILDDTENLNDANIEAAERKVSDTEDYLDDAQTYYNRVKEEEGENDATTKSAKLTLDTAQANYNQARKALDVAEATAELEETSAENALNTAEADLAAVRSDFVEASNDASVAAFQAAYQTALTNLGKAVLRAPASGVIKKTNFKTGEILTSTLANPFAEMISFDLILEASVPESDIAKIEVGQIAELMFDAFDPEEKFRATVVSVEPSATVVQDVVDYVVKLTMEKEDPRRKDGMSADVDVLVEQKPNVLVIPERAVRDADGKKIVRVLADGQPEDREVKLGLRGDEGMVEVVNGLNEGEQVITSTK